MRTLIVLLLFASLGSAQQTLELRHRDITVLDLSGSPHERGLAHGRALKPQIEVILADFRESLEREARDCDLVPRHYW